MDRRARGLPKAAAVSPAPCLFTFVDVIFGGAIFFLIGLIVGLKIADRF